MEKSGRKEKKLIYITEHNVNSGVVVFFAHLAHWIDKVQKKLENSKSSKDKIFSARINQREYLEKWMDTDRELPFEKIIYIIHENKEYTYLTNRPHYREELLNIKGENTENEIKEKIIENLEKILKRDVKNINKSEVKEFIKEEKNIKGPFDEEYYDRLYKLLGQEIWRTVYSMPIKYQLKWFKKTKLYKKNEKKFLFLWIEEIKNEVNKKEKNKRDLQQNILEFIEKEEKENININKELGKVQNLKYMKSLYRLILQYLSDKFPKHDLIINYSPGSNESALAWVSFAVRGDFPNIKYLWKEYKQKHLKREEQDQDRNYIIRGELYERGYFRESFLTYQVDEFAAKTKKVEIIKKILKKDIDMDPPSFILLLGSRGSGKNRIVKEVVKEEKGIETHYLNCAGLSEELLRSELFGYVKGAFTGADKDKEGILSQVDKKVIVFDEIHHLPPKLQAQLLLAFSIPKKVMYTRVGSTDQEEKEIRYPIFFLSNVSIKELKEKLYPDFFDRISRKIRKLPNLEELLRDDNKEQENKNWEDTFKKIAKENFPDFPEDKIPLLHEIRREMESAGLTFDGNFRTLENIASLIYEYEEFSKDEEIADYLKKGENIQSHVDWVIKGLKEREGKGENELESLGAKFFEKLYSKSRRELEEKRKALPQKESSKGSEKSFYKFLEKSLKIEFKKFLIKKSEKYRPQKEFAEILGVKPEKLSHWKKEINPLKKEIKEFEEST